MKLGSSSRRGIVTGGTWCADHNKFVTHWPDEEEVVQISKQEIRGGGSACNLSINVKHLDPSFPVSTIGLIGDDPDGRVLIEEAETAGVERSGLIVVEGGRTPHTDAFMSAVSGHRTHFYLAGVADELVPNHFDFSQVQARILHLGLPGAHKQLDTPIGNDANGWVTVLKKAKAAGLATNMELCSIPALQISELVNPCLAHLNLLVVNDFEINAIAGTPLNSNNETKASRCLNAARIVLGRGSMELIIVHFPDGAIAVTKDGEELRIPSVTIPENEILGTNGAGDAFAAGALYGIHEDWTLSAAIQMGHAAAAASVRSLGTTDAGVPWQKCLKLASTWGWRTTI